MVFWSPKLVIYLIYDEFAHSIHLVVKALNEKNIYIYTKLSWLVLVAREIKHHGRRGLGHLLKEILEETDYKIWAWILGKIQEAWLCFEMSSDKYEIIVSSIVLVIYIQLAE